MQGLFQDFALEGANVYCPNLKGVKRKEHYYYQCEFHMLRLGGVWGHAPPGNFLIIRLLRLLLVAPETIFPRVLMVSFYCLRKHAVLYDCTCIRT